MLQREFVIDGISSSLRLQGPSYWFLSLANEPNWQFLFEMDVTFCWWWDEVVLISRWQRPVKNDRLLPLQNFPIQTHVFFFLLSLFSPSSSFVFIDQALGWWWCAPHQRLVCDDIRRKSTASRYTCLSTTKSGHWTDMDPVTWYHVHFGIELKEGRKKT